MSVRASCGLRTARTRLALALALALTGCGSEAPSTGSSVDPCVDASLCDDGDPCTEDACEPATGCTHAPVDGPCDDGDACTTGDACAAGDCLATGGLGCDDLNPCTDDACDPQLGCTAAPNTAPCDDASACTIGDACAGGWCLGDPLACDDTLPCTDDACDPVTGCTHAHLTGPCEDGDACTTGDACAGGDCLPTGALECDDLNPCTDDACDPQLGCTAAPNTAPCDDANPCTTGDACAGGWCTAEPVACAAPSGPCAVAYCDPAIGGCVVAQKAQCCGNGVVDAGETCDDGNSIPGDGCGTDCAPDVCVVPPQTATAVGPGGGGAFMSLEAHPADPDILFAASDVGGVLRSLDGGASWKQLGHGLSTQQIARVEVLEPPNDAVVFLATSDGVFKSTDQGDSFAPTNSGIAEAGPFWLHPIADVQAVAAAPLVVWAAIGEGGVSPVYRYQDPYIVYRSDDQGESWSGSLRIALPDPTADPTEVMDPIWARITIHPQDPAVVYVASNYGLYATYDDGVVWYHLGGSPVLQTSDRGITWEPCDLGAACDAWIPPEACAPAVDCLPVLTQVGATRADVRDVEVFVTAAGETWLYAILGERGYLNDATCTGVRGWDADLAHMTGGPYRSTDGGLTWEYLFDPADAALYGQAYSQYLRCNPADTNPWSDTEWNDIEVSPTDPEHYLIGAEYILGGVSVHTSDGWFHTDRAPTCPDHDCFEGGLSQGAWGNQHGPSANHVVVPSWSAEQPDFFLSHSRGVLRGSFDLGEARYLLDHLDSAPDSDNPGYWKTTGLNDFCIYEMVWAAGGEIAVAGSGDSGVVRSSPGLASWQDTSFGGSGGARGPAIVRDDVTGAIYACRYQPGDPHGYGVAVSYDTATTWQYIGGDCGSDDCLGGNGYPDTLHCNALELDLASPPTSRRLLAGTRSGLYTFDPTRPTGAQWQPADGPGCPHATTWVQDIVSFAQPAPVHLVVAQDVSSNESKHGAGPASELEGVFLVELDADPVGCTRLTGGVDVRAPTRLAQARLADGTVSIVVAGRTSYWPHVYQTSWDPGQPELVAWQWAANFNLLSANDPDFADSVAFANRDFTALAVSPSDPALILAGMSADPYFDHWTAQHVYASTDGGLTFRAAHELDFLALRSLVHVLFSPDGDTLYLSPPCGGIIRTPNPWSTGCPLGQACVLGQCVD